MSCLKDDLIQKYIDGEATVQEIARIKDHIGGCKGCATKIANQRKLAGGIKNAINRFHDRPAEVPELVPVQGRTGKSFSRRRMIIYDLAAACIVLFILIVFRNKVPEPQNMIMMVPAFAGDVDANQPVSKQSMIIQVIDADGHVSEYFTEQDELLK